ncbi:Crp/Fnr family transcriptional regulator [Weissella koreensis KACC 15510]|uniref:Crp/Fnr family transcriptional regulator n=1 Tax=Weissella koreensis TaxID=165096 RepID=UPI0002175A63|nr:Crp/Fnr family transcriptional regulator [Weissella koreensis]AEJ23593.1 Crp/Fnr family transcriptional regulator [Weissella koreensis KACC 15510]
MNNLMDIINSINDKEKNYWYKKSFAANKTLLFEGDIADKIYFIEKGAIRLWNNDDGKEITFQFFFEGQVVSSYESFYLKNPSVFSIETIEETDVLVLEKEKLDILLIDSPDLLKIMMNQLSERFIVYTEYFLSRIKESPEERYLSLLEKNSELIKRVPAQYIASFLGITPVSLSRIKNRIK